MSALSYTNSLKPPLLSSLNSIKRFYHNTTETISNTIDEHFFQAQEIRKLKKQLKNYNNNRLVLQQFASNVNSLYKENNSTLALDPRTELVRTIAYEKFGNLNRVWIDIPDYNSSKIYGLVYKEMVAGIVVAKENKALALLNSDIKSTYAVYVGKEKAPGIVHGNNSNYLIVNFIPAWFHIKVGDEVVTSGLDNTFFQGLKVGRITSISKAQGYQTAHIDPYYKSNDPDYFHIIRKPQ